MSTQERVPILSIRGLTIDLPPISDRRYAVEDLSLDVFANEIVCIVGESGSGKSITSFTTMGLLPKVLKPSKGQVLLDGVDLLQMKEREIARLRGSKMAMVFQEPMTALNPCYTVGDQIEEVFAAHARSSADERRAKTLALLEEVRLPDPKSIYSSYPHQLSGGQRQRIVIAMALALEPSLLIADEPTTALDVTTQAQILKLFSELKTRRNAGIVFVTHDFDVVAEIADRVVVMQRGQVVEQGTAEQVLNRPKHPYTRQLIDAVPRRALGGHAPSAISAPTAIEVKGLEKTYRRAKTLFTPERVVQAVKPLDFTIRKGETLGIVGESGSGKSTLVKCLMRLETPDRGSIMVDGVDLAVLSKGELRKHRKNIQIVFQDPYASLNPRRTIGDQLIEGPTNFGVDRKVSMAKARDLLRLVRLEQDALSRYPAQFSGGQRQRICIARALMMEPRILIADEAVSALDVSVQKEVLKLLSDVKAQMGLTMIFITHDLRVAAQVSDNLIVMQKGEVVERGNVDEIFGNAKHQYTKQLMDAIPGKHWEAPENLEPTANGADGVAGD